MTQPASTVVPHMRLTWGGSLSEPALDIWANQLAWKFQGEAPSAAELANIVITVAPIIAGLISSGSQLVSPAVYLDWVKAVWVLTNGKQRDVNTEMYEFPHATRPQGASASVPWHQTYAVTLRTAINRGRGHAGRIFPPPSGPAPVGGTPYAALNFATSLASQYAGTIAAVRSAINDVINPDRNTGGSNDRFAAPALVSRSTPGQAIPLLTEILTCVVDRVADVQHRRTNRVERAEGTEATIV